jgi:hypothetical protein
MGTVTGKIKGEYRFECLKLKPFITDKLQVRRLRRF